MRVGWSRRSRKLAAWRGALALAAVVGVSLSATSIASASSPCPGSSCAHPATASFKPGDDNFLGGGRAEIAYGIQTEHPWWVVWSVRKGYIVCSARVQLRDGAWVRPTRLSPYATPTPWGGEYRESRHSRSPLRQVVITAARSPVTAGSSCNYPLWSAQTLGGPSGDTTDMSVNVLFPGYQGDGTGLETTFKFQLEVTVNNPRVVICSAELTVNPPNAEGFFRSNLYTEYPVAIPPHGGRSAILGPVSTDDGITGRAYGRYE